MKRIYLIYFFLLVFSFSCTENFDEFNTDEKNPTQVEGEFLFTQGQKELMDQISSTNVNLNIWKLWAQYWTETTYTDEENYDIVNRTIADNAFDIYYTNVLKAFDEARRLIQEDDLEPNESEAQRTNKLMIIELMEVFAYQNLVNIFGNIPYENAMEIENISPSYDDASAVYSDLVSRVNNAISSMDPGAPSFTSADVVYNGDIESWMRFANSLKLKIAINAADASSEVDFNVQTAVEEAVSAGVISSASENALFPYQGSSPNTNPLHEDLVLSGRKDFVPANTIIDTMVGLSDPRLDNFFTNKIDTSDNDIDDPVWLGGRYGYSASYATHSHIGSRILEPTFPGFFMTYTEVQFYIAEAAARGFDVGKTAEEAYNDGVTASILYWGGSETEATEYLNNHPYTSYGSWKEAIGLQSWLAAYTRGFIGYTTYRRLDQPDIMNTPDPDVYKTVNGVVPLRFTYPVNEQTLNAENYRTAADAIGGDELETPLFWDVSTPF